MLKVFANVTLKKTNTFTLIHNMYYSHCKHLCKLICVYGGIVISQTNKYLHYYSLWIKS